MKRQVTDKATGGKCRRAPGKLLLCGYRWVTQLCDPLHIIRGLAGMVWLFGDWRNYARLPGAERISLIDSWPQVHDRTGSMPFDAHYYYVSGWAARRIVASRLVRHVDVGSLALFANLLSATVPVTFVEYRPLHAHLSGMRCVAGDILHLPFADGSLESLSCLHVAEHVGLGRYGDRLDPQGTLLAARELARVLAPEGTLYFALPVGKPRLCFNSHRIHRAETIRDYFAELQLVEFSAVDDAGRFLEGAVLEDFSDADYACGMFCFKKPHRSEK
jgi:SAM-dependent methyltransferase